MGFPRLEYWGGLPFPSPGDLPYSGSALGKRCHLKGAYCNTHTVVFLRSLKRGLVFCSMSQCDGSVSFHYVTGPEFIQPANLASSLPDICCYCWCCSERLPACLGTDLQKGLCRRVLRTDPWKGLCRCVLGQARGRGLCWCVLGQARGRGFLCQMHRGASVLPSVTPGLLRGCASCTLPTNRAVVRLSDF